jgi:ubiquinone/menaquinone biosynthesis C-methylase UbiE
MRLPIQEPGIYSELDLTYGDASMRLNDDASRRAACGDREVSMMRFIDGVRESRPRRRSVVIALLPAMLLPWLTGGCLSTMTDYHGQKLFNPIYLFYLESPKRDRWQMPEQVLDALRVGEGAVVADIGAGGGYFTEKFARRVGPNGHVYANDVQDVMLRKLSERVRRHGLTNVTVIRGEFEDPKLPANSCDLVFFSSVYKEITHRAAYLRLVRDALKRDGRVAILEYRMDESAPGPPRKYRLPAQQVIEELQAAGYHLAEQFDFLPREYFLVFEPDAEGHASASHLW